jgi:phage terminase large subunit
VHRELGTGKTRQQTLAELGIVTQVVPMARFEAGVDAVRNMFPSLWIDKSCDRLINALRNYRKELDEVRGIYKEKPVHDWTSHGADMVRYMALTSPTKSNWGRKIEHRQLAIV